MIRGGAIGDFVLTLPAIKLLRDAWPHARLEILGYKHIIALAERRFYADAVRSIEYGALASFFAKGAELPTELCEYFGSFDLIISYLFDPDEVFENNLRRCGSTQIIRGPAKLRTHEHAAVQLARPLSTLGLELEAHGAQLFPTAADHATAAAFLPGNANRLLALHPGSGSAAKNWPLGNWLSLGQQLARDAHLVVIGGEADTAQIAELRAAWSGLPVSFVVDQPLTSVAAVLARCKLFIGHDSGISHIAAAVGTRCVLLFGPTDPRVWAPAGKRVHVLSAGDRNLESISVAVVI
ncbi:MAG: glycosyltransferase family 9 protein, partial [Verrucomicrobiota bacterium]|nr:glycosyltransferase family 9 protein [Verrucomicrobiota bacterium]